MNISPINYQPVTPSFKANLHVSECVKKVVKSNEKTFMNAATMCSEWLKKDKAHIHDTMFIRKNTSAVPTVAFERTITETVHAYPHEDTGYTRTRKEPAYEDLEFQVGNRICGFWFDKESDANKLLSDFKNMFNYLTK